MIAEACTGTSDTVDGTKTVIQEISISPKGKIMQRYEANMRKDNCQYQYKQSLCGLSTELLGTSWNS